MKLENVTEKDGLAIAHLIRMYNSARFDGVGVKELSTFQEGLKFLNWLAVEVAGHLRTPQPIPEKETPKESLRIKAMGPLSGGTVSKKKKKDKK